MNLCWKIIWGTVYSDADFYAQTFDHSLEGSIVKHLWSQRYVKIVFHHHWSAN